MREHGHDSLLAAVNKERRVTSANVFVVKVIGGQVPPIPVHVTGFKSCGCRLYGHLGPIKLLCCVCITSEINAANEQYLAYSDDVYLNGGQDL